MNVSKGKITNQTCENASVSVDYMSHKQSTIYFPAFLSNKIQHHFKIKLIQLINFQDLSYYSKFNSKQSSLDL